MITYGHEKYIKQAIESILDQVVNFEIELIIANDSSPDETDEIIKSLLSTHEKANLITYTNQEINLGILKNFVFVLQKSKGEYIAICEGDDYWTDPLKLQKQVDAMRSNTEFAGVAHNAQITYENSNKKDQLFRKFSKNQVFGQNDFLSHRLFHTASILFKNLEFNEDSFPKDITSADRVLFLLISQYGSIYYINETMCCYRKNDSGISSRVLPKTMQKDLKIPGWFEEKFPGFPKLRYLSFIHNTIISYSTHLNLKQFSYHGFMYFILSFSYFPKNLTGLAKYTIKELPVNVRKLFKP